MQLTAASSNYSAPDHPTPCHTTPKHDVGYPSGLEYMREALQESHVSVCRDATLLESIGAIDIAIVMPNTHAATPRVVLRAFLSHLQCLCAVLRNPESFHAFSSCCQIPPSLGVLERAARGQDLPHQQTQAYDWLLGLRPLQPFRPFRLLEDLLRAVSAGVNPAASAGPWVFFFPPGPLGDSIRYTDWGVGLRPHYAARLVAWHW
jgi:hypothetical protein